MAGDETKPSIPAWQLRAQQQPLSLAKTDDGIKVEGTGTPATSNGPAATESGLPVPDSPVIVPASEVSTTDDATSASQLESMKTFLEDPAVKNAPLEKKRAFFESKGIPSKLIDKALKSEASTFSANDFESFKSTESQALQPSLPPAQPVQQAQPAPPIITYPEFLVEAHKPPPLITPTRIINTAYIAGTLYALLYGASKYLVQPMSLSLSDARHDFAQHSQSKLDEMNERLTKLVSKVPEKRTPIGDSEIDTDAESETSDPTELYHRDMGTQTSPPPSRRSSSALSTETAKKDNLTHSTNVLSILQSHLNEMLDRANGLEQSNKDRQDSMTRLRAYLDNLIYSSPGSYGLWGAGNAFEEEKKDASKEEDVIEEVKKEIRGVKGVLLSAKRFPGVAGRVGG